MKQFARSDTAASQSDTELVAAPGDDRQIVVYAVHVSADAAEEVTLNSRTDAATPTNDVRWKVHLGGNGTYFAQSDAGLFRCGTGDSLVYDSTASGDTFVSVTFDTVRSTGA